MKPSLRHTPLRLAGRLLCLLLLLSLLPALPACAPKKEVYRTGIDSFCVDAEGNATLTVGLAKDALRANEGGSLALIELLPGETAEDAAKKPPLCEAKAEAWVRFCFPLAEGTHNRLYSSFAVRLADGSLLSPTPVYLTDPTPMADSRSEIPQCRVIKGVHITDTALTLGDPSADYAASLGATKAEIRVGLSALLPGNAVNLAALEELDRRIEDAYEAGLALTLTLVPDLLLPIDETTLLMDQLAARYATGLHGGMIASLALLAEPTLSATEAATLLRLSQLAFASRNPSITPYVLSKGRSLTETLAFFDTVGECVAAGGDFLWGAGVVPVISNPKAWEKDDTDAVTLQDLYDLTQYLTEKNNRHPRPFLVEGIQLVNTDEETMAASLVYAYRTALHAGANLFFYETLREGEGGLRALDGSTTLLGKVYSTVDTKDVETERICLRAMGSEVFASLPKEENKRLDTLGVASIGSLAEDGAVLFDFSTGRDHGFSPVGEASMPEKHDSSAWSAPVLYTWFNPTEPGIHNGIRRLLAPGELLPGSTTLSVDLLTQLPKGGSGRIRLTLVGTASGARLLRHTSEISLSESSWQTVDFGISNFMAELSADSPVLLTLEVLPDTPSDTSYVFWLRQMRTVVPATPSPQSTDWMLLGILLASAGGAFLASILLYRLCSRRRRGRDR